MIEQAMPAGTASATVRSFAACLTAVLEIDSPEAASMAAASPRTDPAVLPSPLDELRQAVASWRQWLAGRGLGLVEVAEAQRFNWPGYWIAVVRSEQQGAVCVLLFGTPPAVVLSPATSSLVGCRPVDLSIIKSFVVAGLDPAASTGAPSSRVHGVVEAIAVAASATAQMRLVDIVRAHADRGLDGDRYAEKAGTFSSHRPGARGYDLTLVEAEVLDALVLPDGSGLTHLASRRNVLTRGIDLNSLVGERFFVGDVECLGQRLCEPCAHLERLSSPGALKALIHRGGLRADIVGDGTIRVGATVRAARDAPRD